MRERIAEFTRLLRQNDVRVSTSELLDAAAAVDAVGWTDVRAVRAALSTTLIKEQRDRATFGELFDLYFLRGSSSWVERFGRSLLEQMVGEGMSREAAERLLASLQQGAAELSAAARLLLEISDGALADALRRAAQAIDVAAMSSPLQVGFYSYQVGERLGLSAGEAELFGLLRQMADAGALSAEDEAGAGAVIRGRVARIRETIREHVDASFRQRNLDYVSQNAAASLVDKPIARLSQREMAALRVEVQRLAQLLRAKLAVRPAVIHRGRLDLARTLRRSLATSGVPVDLVMRDRRRRKPRLVILCDISDSVSHVSRFMLQFVYAVRELFGRVHPFAFVAELGDLTQLFRDHEADRAVDKALSGEVVNVFANSNYGRVLSQFVDLHLGKVNRRTTVVVIGDGRNNYHPARAELLTDVRRRAEKLLWLCPEAPPAWGFGDSAMNEYAKHCDQVAIVRSLSSLQKVVDELASGGA